jgi:pyruvate kinase
MRTTPVGDAQEMRATIQPATDLRELRALVDRLLELRDGIVRDAQQILAGWRPSVRRWAFLPSAQNLAAYLAFRRRDVRTLQDELAIWGLSSLGRSEGKVLANLDAVLVCLAALTGRLDAAARLPRRPRRATFELGDRLLRHNTRALFGPPASERLTHIMVTLPEQAQTDAAFVEALVAHGMSCARINCAHGSHDDWRAMIRNVRAAAGRLGRPCRVVMDLSGPRARVQAAFSREDRKVLPGDVLVLRAGAPDTADDAAPPFQLQVTPPSIIAQLAAGAIVMVDEGRLEALIERAGDGEALGRVTRTPPGGMRLKPEKGLNFPGTDLGIPALTEKDRADLDVVVENADLIGYSFVQSVSDIETLWRELEPRLARTGRRAPGLILKIETEQAVRHLPGLIVAAGGRVPLGVMIARGDLAVEVGFQRLAELQEEILWLAEAAHTPVIWATQVLDRLVRKGTPSRAEISDVVLAQRAECVMLNKGDFILDALTIVDDVFRRMEGHQHKKTSRLRALRAWS